jgi:hypothetical protein
MGLKAIQNKVTSKVGRQVLIVRKNSPTLLFGVGVAGVITTVVLACRATLKMEEVLREAEKKQLQIEDAQALQTEEYTEKDAAQDAKLNRIQTAWAITKLYAPAVGAGVISVTALTGSHVVLTRRNTALGAAYVALDKGFREYRARVVNEYGKAKDDEFRFGLVDKQIAVETDHGTDVKTIKAPDRGIAGKSIYARFFDETSSNWQRTPGYNQMFLQAQQNYANDLLNARGWLFLNEVYRMLGLEESSAGQIVGWVKGEHGGDGFVDFGIFDEGDNFMALQFVNGAEKSVLLDFNVDGPVYDLLPRKV